MTCPHCGSSSSIHPVDAAACKQYAEGANLLRENAELRASNARMREALQVAEPYCCGRAHSKVRKALAETPAASLTAITAPLEAHIERLKEGLQSAQLCYNPNNSTCWCHPSNQEGRHESHCMWIRERFDETPDMSLTAIQDAARAEERAACALIADEYGRKNSQTGVWVARDIRSRGNGGETKAEGQSVPDLIVENGQELQIWGMQVEEDRFQIAFDCGDNGFLVLTDAQRIELIDVLTLPGINTQFDSIDAMAPREDPGNGGEPPKRQANVGICKCGHLRMEHEPDCLFCDCKAYEFVARGRK